MLKRIACVCVLSCLILPLLARAGDAAETPDSLRAKLARYEELVNQDAPGSAWFRHQIEQIHKQLGEKENDQAAGRPMPGRRSELSETFGLFSGTRALSENLQLDRKLRLNLKPGQPVVDLSSIEGITVKEYDWAQRIKELHPRLDPLASLIPSDQHAVFFPTFNSAVALIDEADKAGTPLLELFDQRSEDSQTRTRYERQLCLSLSGIGRLLGPQVINSVAVTGSDPYLRTGSDLAILFEPRDAPTLRKLLEAQIGIAQKLTPAAKSVSGQIEGIDYAGAVSPDRAVCSYIATVGNSVVVTNSLPQLRRLILTQQGKIAPLSAQGEYIFFRDRYKLGDPDETALIIVTDATIRRWCSPRWRIADSRRTRAAAILSEYQAKFADDLVARDVFPTPIPTENGDLGQLQLTPAGVSSSLYGSLEFMTPISELPMEQVTAAEAEAYNAWRTQYQNYWKQYFDPIAVRLTVKPEKLAADLTIMPLIVRSDYADFVRFSAGAKLDPRVGDPHDTLFHAELALNFKSDAMKRMWRPDDKVLEGLTGAVGIYMDDDPDYWKTVGPQADLELSLKDMPIAARVELKKDADHAPVVDLLHALFTSPDQPIAYNGHHYMKTGSRGMKLAAYYAFTDQAFILSLNEKVIQRALDRADAKPSQPEPAWLGQNLSATVSSRLFERVLPAMHPSYKDQLQKRSWANIPILNEWKRLYPNQDPVKVHQRLWGTILLDPAGGTYVWNEKAQTMESTTFGCPAAPKMPKGVPAILRSFSTAQFGLDFEDSGLRARAVLNRKPMNAQKKTP